VPKWSGSTDRLSRIALIAEQLAAVIRLEGAANEVLVSARAVEGREHVRLATIGETLSAVIQGIRSAIAGVEPLETEFAALVPNELPIFWRNVEPRASAVVGWLRGVIAAESLQARIEAEARAYAEARVRSERQVGFTAPPEG
jgi:hypothetical protein